MYTIIKNNKFVIEIKKSTFIALIFKVDTIDDVIFYLNKSKKEYKDAKHYCYAYIIDDKKKYSDDGEPGGTAGLPIMEVLIKHNLNLVLCIVVRYFGGIKLGAGGLVRAYTKATSGVIDKHNIIELKDGYKIQLITDYSKQKEIDNILRDVDYEKHFNEKIVYIIKCETEFLDLLNHFNINYNIIEKIKIKKS